MMIDARCPNGHLNEYWVTSGTREVRCEECDQQARRVISGTRPILDPISGDFPGATMKWARHHEQMAKKNSD